MDRRKLQLLGGTTLSVSVPKNWARTMGLEAGAAIDLEPRPDGTLLLRPVRPLEEPQGRTATLDASGLTTEQIERRVTSLYLSGCERIEVVGRTGLAPATRASLDDLSRRVSGLEIVETSPDRYVLQDMIDARGFDMARAFDRMYGVASALHRDVLAALAERDPKRLADVPARLHDIDRLAWVMTKQQRAALRSAHVVEHPAGAEDILAFASATSLVQRMGAIGAELADAARPLLDLRLDARVLAGALEVGSAALNLCDESARAFYKADLSAADAAMAKTGPLDARIHELRAFTARTATTGGACAGCLGTTRFLEGAHATIPVGSRLAQLATERALLEYSAASAGGTP